MVLSWQPAANLITGSVRNSAQGKNTDRSKIEHITCNKWCRGLYHLQIIVPGSVVLFTNNRYQGPEIKKVSLTISCNTSSGVDTDVKKNVFDWDRPLQKSKCLLAEWWIPDADTIELDFVYIVLVGCQRKKGTQIVNKECAWVCKCKYDMIYYGKFVWKKRSQHYGELHWLLIKFSNKSRFSIIPVPQLKMCWGRNGFVSIIGC